MLVKEWMSKNVITTETDESVKTAEKMLLAYNIHSLPVLHQGSLTGIVTGGDIKRAIISASNTFSINRFLKSTSSLLVSEVMTKNVKTVSLLNTISETINIFLKHRILGVPVVDEKGEMVGIITKTDIFNALTSLTSMDKKGIDIGFQVEDRPGSIKEITDIIRLHDGRIASILASYERASIGHRNVYIRVYNIDRSNLIQIRSKILKKTKLHYIIDPFGQTRELF
ncbi:CBS and ACT domain-containing protein [bacterium]|nr:CBS and ACT domain-containing protein [bacterium]